MRSFLYWTLIALIQISQPAFSGPFIEQAQADSDEISIAQPAGGEAIQGSVSIEGTANPPDFFFYELSFGYAGSDQEAWFVIVESFTPVEEGILGEWDTFAITDGDYDLRLVVTLSDASTIETLVEGIRVRNYSQAETSTPGLTFTPTASTTPDLTAMFTPSATPTITPSPTARATFTPLARNPAEFQTDDISTSMARGAAGVLAVFILVGLYISIQGIRRR